MGGIQTAAGARRGRQQGRPCAHSATMSTIAAGLERVVCEACGHLSFRWHEDVSDYIERERDKGTPTSMELTIDNGAFAIQARLHIRSRYELHPEPSVAAV